MKFFAPLRVAKRAPLMQVAKSGVAIIVSWFAASYLLGESVPVFAAIATLLVVAPSVNQSFAKGIERSLGVIAGVIIAMAVSLAFGSAGWVVLVAILVAMAFGWLLKVSPGMANQFAISAMLVIALGGGTIEYSMVRILETVIGAVVGIIVNMLIVPPVLVEPAREKLADLGGEIAASMERLADAMVTPQTPAQLQELMIEVRLITPMVEAAEKSIDEGFESLMLNPRKSKLRGDLEDMRALLIDKLRPIAMQVRGMTRAFFDHYEESLADEPAGHDIADQLDRAAHDVRLAVHLADVDPEPMTSAVPALTAPLVLSPPTRGNWILVGSLMEDLRRIRLALVGE